MRDNEYRGKSKKYGKWVFGYLRSIYTGYTICPGKTFDSDGFYDLEELSVIPETVGQYIGLTDGKGNKIFEGDLFKDSKGQLWIIVIYAALTGHGVIFPNSRVADRKAIPIMKMMKMNPIMKIMKGYCRRWGNDT